ncbi:hypothetical protein ACOMHN_061494 [Nucella lapillus]
MPGHGLKGHVHRMLIMIMRNVDRVKLIRGRADKEPPLGHNKQGRVCVEGSDPLGHNKQGRVCVEGSDPLGHNKQGRVCVEGSDPLGHNKQGSDPLGHNKQGSDPLGHNKQGRVCVEGVGPAKSSLAPVRNAHTPKRPSRSPPLHQ